MKNRTLLIILVLLSLGAVSFDAVAVETARQVIANTAKALNEAPSLDVKANVETSQGTFAVNMKIARDKFVLDYPQMKVWYDGTTQWTYVKDQRELSISDPTEDELLECNPFAIINYYGKVYSARRLQGNETTIELVANNTASTNIRKAVVTVSPTTYFPEKIVVTFANGKTMTVRIVSVKKGPKLAASTFVYDKNKYPAAETVDLR